ncbi:MAG: hypothetical protein N2111_04505 [Candidatus Sumerlaeaceae bacterium]|nr:hypothetical protein [Candidatus Sumerlaeaceae bacterium]
MAGVIAGVASAARPGESDGEWRKFEGEWFTVEYPANFKVRPSLKLHSHQTRPDSAFFTAPGGEVEFYVFSPQWSGEPSDIMPDPKTEIVNDETTRTEGGRTVREWDIKARDGSYFRAIADTTAHEGTVRWVFGIKYRDKASYDRWRPTYLRFKKSLQQFAD